MDQSITRWINALAGLSAPRDAIMVAITTWGVPLLVAAVVLQWWSANDRRHVRYACVSAGLAFVIGLGANQIMLLFVHRIRPYDAAVSHLLIAPTADWSFPSDHATAAFAIVASFTLARLPVRAFVFGVVAIVICFSRVYVGMHYLSDVVGGAAMGTLAALFARMVYREGTRIDRAVTAVL